VALVLAAKITHSILISAARRAVQSLVFWRRKNRFGVRKTVACHAPGPWAAAGVVAGRVF